MRREEKREKSDTEKEGKKDEDYSGPSIDS
jgi:hypothetical protein